MSNVILIIHLILALLLVGIVLLQRSEGGGLGIGGGGGGLSSGRSAATALGKLTWILAICFIITSTALTILAARDSAGDSVIERLGTGAAEGDGPALPLLDGESLLPPSDDTPITPPKEN